MRNWNYNIIINPTAATPSFYSTYEELKPGYIFNTLNNFTKFLQYLWGIETISF